VVYQRSLKNLLEKPEQYFYRTEAVLMPKHTNNVTHCHTHTIAHDVSTAIFQLNLRKPFANFDFRSSFVLNLCSHTLDHYISSDVLRDSLLNPLLATSSKNQVIAISLLTTITRPFTTLLYHICFVFYSQTLFPVSSTSAVSKQQQEKDPHIACKLMHGSIFWHV